MVIKAAESVLRLLCLCKKAQIFDKKAETLNNGKWSIFHFDNIPVEYTGTLSIGRSFDYRYWQHDEKTTPVPFSPDVFKENGYIKFEKGLVQPTSEIVKKLSEFYQVSEDFIYKNT